MKTRKSAVAHAILRQKNLPTHTIGGKDYKGRQPQYEAVNTLDPQTGLETVFYVRTAKGVPFVKVNP